MHNVFRALWPSIVSWTESIGKGTDYLRVDYFVNAQDCVCVASEMNVFAWPESQFFAGFLQLQKDIYICYLKEMKTSLNKHE